ncbi:dual specificity protein phosphatase, putative [Trypanosoma equiperdum]|uniref:protein-tyrosine-phosphatase n=1 Tax=Trypanosoma equiperdum TaxID=5694 RepID=A0A1G4IA55_TRYEQ|nr:dual specificity protein phosphatase, putative [Trypanosoma equiperdum]
MGACIAALRGKVAGKTNDSHGISDQSLPTAESTDDSVNNRNGKFNKCIRGEESISSGDMHGKEGSDLSKSLTSLWGVLSKTEFADFFRAHPELLKSNSAAVMCTGAFRPGELVGAYCVVKELPGGTVGRSFLVKAVDDSGPPTPTVTTPEVEDSGKREFVFKVMTFINRKNLVEPVLDDKRALMNLTGDGLLRPVHLLLDEGNETVISVTPFLKEGSCARLAGKLEEDRLLSILRDVASALRLLHSHNIYHCNLKLENVLLREDGKACLADAALWRIFSTQSRDCLLFNGELACMPPEMFMIDEADNQSKDASKVDIWGFGLFMYRLAYGREPFDIEGKALEQVCELVSVDRLQFPQRNWSIASSLEDAIRVCLDDDPERRPTVPGLFSFSLFRNYNFNSVVAGGSVGLPGFRASHNDTGPSGGRSGSDNYIRWAYPRYHWRKNVSLDEMLGSGGICETYRVHLRRHPSKQFVMKVLKRSVLKAASQYRISTDDLRHALAVSRLINHPNVLNLLEIVDSRDGCFASQQLAKSRFLYAEFPPLLNHKNPLFTLKQMLADVLQGLFVLHLNGVPHLRLTPSNIFYELGVGFRVSDFGPLFLAREEIVESMETDQPLYSVPQWVVDDLKVPIHMSRFSLDVFCVGLLAASALPSVLHEDWYRFSNSEGCILDVKGVCEKVKNASLYLKPMLVDFILQALTNPATTVRDLMNHSYLSDAIDVSRLDEMKPLNISPADMEMAVSERFTTTDESGLWNVLGHDPAAGNGHLWCSMFRNEALPDGCIRSGIQSVNEVAAARRVPFVKKLVCGLCRCELPIVLFLCDKCDDYIRCAKCSLVDTHADDHKLSPHLVHTVGQDGVDGNFFALLVPTCNICVAQSLEALEMQANLPHGTLTKDITTQSVTAERALRRLTLAKLNPGPKVLPKVSDTEGETWEEEVASCRETRNTELLLHQFELNTVPKELFDPPLLHVASIDLSYNKLTSLPDDLALLCNLRSVSVAHNALTVLPDSMGELRQLDRLDASHNKLKDLPLTFVKLRKLSTVTLDFNEFSGLPRVLDDLIVATASTPQLSTIYLAENTNITRFPDYTNLAILPTLKLALDNEPSVYQTYLNENLAEKLPNIGMLWNKIYPDRIVDNVFCGSLRTTQSQVVYDKLGIKNLLTVGRDLVPVPPVGGKHLVISLDDIEEADIRCTFDEAVNFIDMSVEKGEGCLVHCFAGLSRSATTVIAYFMMKRGMRLGDAYQLTKRGRPSIYPNEGFFRQMIELDGELFPDDPPLQLEDIGRESPNVRV